MMRTTSILAVVLLAPVPPWASEWPVTQISWILVVSGAVVAGLGILLSALALPRTKLRKSASYAANRAWIAAVTSALSLALVFAGLVIASLGVSGYSKETIVIPVVIVPFIVAVVMAVVLTRVARTSPK